MVFNRAGGWAISMASHRLGVGAPAAMDFSAFRERDLTRGAEARDAEGRAGIGHDRTMVDSTLLGLATAFPPLRWSDRLGFQEPSHCYNGNFSDIDRPPRMTSKMGDRVEMDGQMDEALAAQSALGHIK